MTTALVTGTSSGIGLATAVALAHGGHTVAANHAQSGRRRGTPQNRRGREASNSFWLCSTLMTRIPCAMLSPRSSLNTGRSTFWSTTLEFLARRVSHLPLTSFSIRIPESNSPLGRQELLGFSSFNTSSEASSEASFAARFAPRCRVNFLVAVGAQVKASPTSPCGWLILRRRVLKRNGSLHSVERTPSHPTATRTQGDPR